MKGRLTMSRQRTSRLHTVPVAATTRSSTTAAAPGPSLADRRPYPPGELATLLSAARDDVWGRTDGGLRFLLAAVVVWITLGILGVVGVTEQSVALVYLGAAGLVFPLALLLGHDVLARANPLARLGALLSGLQVLLLPILLWALLHEPSVVPWFLGTLTSAQLLPFGWLYGGRAYPIGAILGVAVAAGTGFAFPLLTFLLTPFAIAAVFGLTALLIAHQSQHRRR